GRGLLATPTDVAHLPVTPDALVDLEQAPQLVAGADLVSVMTANNEVGTVQPLAALATIAREVAPAAVLHTDAIAAAPWLDLAVVAPQFDLVSICAHKLGGPVGIGALCFRREVALAPLLVGGGQERGRRSGTPDVASAVGLAVALRLCVAEREAAVALTSARRDQLCKLLTNGIDGIRATVAGVPILPGTCHVTIDGVSSEELVFLCDEAGLCVSAASSCASGASRRSHVLEAMGAAVDRDAATLRLSLGHDTTDDEVARAAAVVIDAVRRLRG
ncbi:MAG TPA: aminotransferase class V-fold PLP-dependent enzyme, partial [Acidimicrobiales bacterium]|nr:aminotransferase class V-fold PLP-dependent enzyme [Acidimicrobiales bacterium]